MKRICAAAFLLLCFWLQARAGSHGAAFVYHSNKDGEGIFTPMYPPQIGVELKSGPAQLNKGEVLICKQGQEKTKVIADGAEATVVSFTLTCQERVFVLKSIYFEEGTN